MLNLITGVPRLPIRKRTPSEMLVPIADRLKSAMFNTALAQHTSSNMLRALVTVADSCLAWATTWISDNFDQDIVQTKVRIRTVSPLKGA